MSDQTQTPQYQMKRKVLLKPMQRPVSMRFDDLPSEQKNEVNIPIHIQNVKVEEPLEKTTRSRSPSTPLKLEEQNAVSDQKPLPLKKVALPTPQRRELPRLPSFNAFPKDPVSKVDPKETIVNLPQPSVETNIMEKTQVVSPVGVDPKSLPVQNKALVKNVTSAVPGFLESKSETVVEKPVEKKAPSIPSRRIPKKTEEKMDNVISPPLVATVELNIKEHTIEPIQPLVEQKSRLKPPFRPQSHAYEPKELFLPPRVEKPCENPVYHAPESTPIVPQALEPAPETKNRPIPPFKSFEKPSVVETTEKFEIKSKPTSPVMILDKNTRPKPPFKIAGPLEDKPSSPPVQTIETKPKLNPPFKPTLPSSVTRSWKVETCGTSSPEPKFEGKNSEVSRIKEIYHKKTQSIDNSRISMFEELLKGQVGQKMEKSFDKKTVSIEHDLDALIRLTTKLISEAQALIPKEEIKTREKKDKREEREMKQKPATLEMKKKVIGKEILQDISVEQRGSLQDEVRGFKGFAMKFKHQTDTLSTMMNPNAIQDQDESWKKTGGKILSFFKDMTRKEDKKEEGKKEEVKITIDREYSGYIVNFMSIFTVPDVQQGFMSHLRKESNAEPLEFILDIHKLKRDTHLTTVQKFFEIIELYIRQGSQKEVNISGIIRNQILDTIKNQNTKKPWRVDELPVDLLESAKKQAYLDLKSDVWPRFILSLVGYEIISKYANNPLVMSKEPSSAVQFKLQKSFFGTNVDDVDEKTFIDVANKLSYPKLFVASYLNLESVKIRNDGKNIDTRRLTIISENVAKRKMKVKILFMKKQSSNKQGLKKFLNPVFQTIANDQEVFQTALLIGPWILDWDESEICVPRTCVSGSMLLSTDADGGATIDMNDEKFNQLAKLICKWNVEFGYSKKSCSQDSNLMTGNSQDFVDCILQTLDIKIHLSTPFQEFVNTIKETGTSELQFKMNSEFCTKFNIQKDAVVFDAHGPLDTFVNGLLQKDKLFKMTHVAEFQFLKSFDRAFWIRCTNIKNEINKKNMLLSDCIKDVSSESKSDEKIAEIHKKMREYSRELMMMLRELSKSTCLRSGCPFGDPTAAEVNLQ